MEVIARRIFYQLSGNWLRVNCGILWGTAWTIIKMSNNNNSCCSNIFHVISKEFRRENLSLTHEPVEDFLKSQWQTSQRSFLWMLYRWGLAICFSVGVIGSLIQLWYDGLWFIYLTDWGFLLCMAVSLFGAILVTIYYFNPNKFNSDCKILKVYWVCHWTTLVIATIVSFMYWLFIYPRDNASASDLYNLWAHGFNSILMVLDHMLVAFPSRLMHFVYPLCVGILYGLFSLVYYLAGGVDMYGHHYIYVVLDWSQPGWALLTAFGCIVLVIVFSFLLFCLYKLRSAIYRRRMNDKLSITI